jgi:hypothetical protein
MEDSRVGRMCGVVWGEWTKCIRDGGMPTRVLVQTA